MGIALLQEFIESKCKEACVPVDLFQISRSQRMKATPTELLNSAFDRKGRFALVLDAEGCLDRMYGGFYSDWACGGQWNKMLTFVNSLTHQCINNNMYLVVYFNGCLENNRMKEWHSEQAEAHKKVNSIFRHVNNKGTPPPKIWWLSPPCLRMTLRMAFRQMGVPVACSMDDHPQEVIAYCRENYFHGLFAQSSEYFVFDPPRFFSSRHLKLTFKGTLETKEYFVDNAAHCIDLNPNRFPIMAALLGNHILSEEDLKDFHNELVGVTGANQQNLKANPEQVIIEVISFVRSLVSVDDLDAIGRVVFRYKPDKLLQRVIRLKQCVQYYVNGTEDGFLRYRPKLLGNTKQQGMPGATVAQKLQQQEDPVTAPPEATAISVNDEHTSELSEPALADPSLTDLTDLTDPVLSNPTLSDSALVMKEELVIEADSIYTQAETGYGSSDASAPQIIVDPPNQSGDAPSAPNMQEITEKMDADLETKMAEITLDEGGGDSNESEAASTKKQELDANKLQTCLSSSSSSGGSTPYSISPDPTWITTVKPIQAAQLPKPSKKDPALVRHLPTVSHEIMRVASERHQKGLMSPWIYQVLSQGQIMIPVTLEDENSHDLPSAAVLYRSLRQQVYAILFNLGHRPKKANNKKSYGNSEVDMEVTVKEWVYAKGQSKCEEVKATALDWAVPTIHRLWLGQQVEDKNRRLRAFLTCLKSDAPLMLNVTYVPQHLLLLCCVLRYIMQHERPVLRRHELDVFLVQAISPVLQDVQTMSDLQMPTMTTRGIQLGALFMCGIECALFANDACGLPILWTSCVPWEFFDGKLFHYKLIKANNNATLIDLCDGQVDQVMRVERLRQAILQGIPYNNFAMVPLPLLPNPFQSYGPYGNTMYRPAGGLPAGASFQPSMGAPRPGPPRGRSLLGNQYGQFHGQQRQSDTRGGRLEIAGVVVGSWGGNPGNRRPGYPPQPYNDMNMPPYHGPMGRGMSISGGRPVRGRGGPPRGPMVHRGHRSMPRRGKSGTAITLEQQMRQGTSRGRGLSVEDPSSSGGVVLASTFINKVDPPVQKEDAKEPESDVVHSDGTKMQYEDADVTTGETLKDVIEAAINDGDAIDQPSSETDVQTSNHETLSNEVKFKSEPILNGLEVEGAEHKHKDEPAVDLDQKYDGVIIADVGLMSPGQDIDDINDDDIKFEPVSPDLKGQGQPDVMSPDSGVQEVSDLAS